MDAQLAAVLTGGRSESGMDLLSLMIPSSLQPLMAADGGGAQGTTPLSPILKLHQEICNATGAAFPLPQVCLPMGDPGGIGDSLFYVNINIYHIYNLSRGGGKAIQCLTGLR